MLFTYNVHQLRGRTLQLCEVIRRGLLFEQKRKLNTPVIEQTNITKNIPTQTYPKPSPSHCCPSSETLKPGWHIIHVKEPSVFVHVPKGHVAGSAHSSISGVKQHTLINIYCKNNCSSVCEPELKTHAVLNKPTITQLSVIWNSISCGAVLTDVRAFWV